MEPKYSTNILETLPSRCSSVPSSVAPVRRVRVKQGLSCTSEPKVVPPPPPETFPRRKSFGAVAVV
eukprot:3183916-Amphidinium_carterae.1